MYMPQVTNNRLKASLTQMVQFSSFLQAPTWAALSRELLRCPSQRVLIWLNSRRIQFLKSRRIHHGIYQAHWEFIICKILNSVLVVQR